MKFKRIDLLSFGKFENESFTFSDGLNIVYGANEAGKSTLSSAIGYILYGFSSQKSRSVETNDKLKYTSWKNGTLSASAIVSAGAKDYRIERSPALKGSLKVQESSGKECNFGKEPGEAFLGVDEESFVKMSCIRQNEVSSEAMDGISDIVQNIVYSADESVDISKARKKLTDYRNVFRSPHRKTGKCYELEEKISSLRYSLGEASEAHKTLLGAEAKLTEIKKRIKHNEGEIEKMRLELLNIEGFEAAQIIEKVLDAKKKLDAAKAEYDSCLKLIEKNGKIIDEKTLSEMILAHDALLRSESEMLSAKKAYEQLKNESKSEGHFKIDAEKLSKIKKAYLSKEKTTRICDIFAGIFAILAVVCAVLGYFSVLMLHPSFIGAALLLIIAAVLFATGLVLHSKAVAILKENGFSKYRELLTYEDEYGKKRESFFAESARERILSDTLSSKTEIYDACRLKLSALTAPFGKNVSEAKDFIEASRLALLRCNNAKAELKKCESVYDAYLSTNDMHALNDAAKHYTHAPEKEKRILVRDIDFITKANEQLSEKEKELIKQASINSSAIRKPSEILAEKEATEELLKKATECADAASLALEALEIACEDLKNGISPEIKKRAGRFFNIFTDGKYEDLEVSGEFGLGVIENGMLKEAAYLSRGTKDIAYLSLRVALCEVLFKEKPVLILDEIFAYIDDKRFKAILSVLEKLSEEYQIFVFTCHEREKAALSEIRGASVIEL